MWNKLVTAAAGDQADRGHRDLHLHGLELVGEYLAEALGVGVGQAPDVYVLATEGEALQVGMAHAGDAQLVELVVATHPGESDAVVDLAHLAQGARRVLGHDGDAAVVAETAVI